MCFLAEWSFAPMKNVKDVKSKQNKVANISPYKWEINSIKKSKKTNKQKPKRG